VRREGRAISTHAEDVHARTAARAGAAQDGQALFAGIMLMVSGTYHGLSGVAATFRDPVYVTTPEYTYAFDLTGWGWTHLVLGALLVVTGVAVSRGRTWGRMTGIVLATLSLVINFLFVPHYPIWSILILFVNVAVVHSLATSLSDDR
jgi:hypothetical protein